MRTGMGLAGVLACGLVLGAAATENNGGAYPNGVEGLMAGALPPPGQYLVNYTVYESADSMKDGGGHTIPIDFKLRAVADVVRFVNVTDLSVLGGNWAQQVFLPLLWCDVEA